jgi:OmpA-OmpF porin, OOP family
MKPAVSFLPAILIALTLPFLVAQRSFAEDDVMNIGNRVPEVNEFKDIFTKVKGAKGLARSGVSMGLKFDFGSDRISEQSRKVLNNLGEALKSGDLSDQKFEVVGHTDAVGSDLYNLRLSERRAKAVKSYLSSNFEISANRLTTQGRGKKELLDQKNPASEVNRRVEVLTKN